MSCHVVNKVMYSTRYVGDLLFIVLIRDTPRDCRLRGLWPALRETTKHEARCALWDFCGNQNVNTKRKLITRKGDQMKLKHFIMWMASFFAAKNCSYTRKKYPNISFFCFSGDLPRYYLLAACGRCSVVNVLLVYWLHPLRYWRCMRRNTIPDGTVPHRILRYPTRLHRTPLDSTGLRLGAARPSWTTCHCQRG